MVLKSSSQNWFLGIILSEHYAHMPTRTIIFASWACDWHEALDHEIAFADVTHSIEQQRYPPPFLVRITCAQERLQNGMHSLSSLFFSWVFDIRMNMPFGTRMQRCFAIQNARMDFTKGATPKPLEIFFQLSKPATPELSDTCAIPYTHSVKHKSLPWYLYQKILFVFCSHF